MKKLVLMVFFMSSQYALAQNELGFMLGDPTGVSFSHELEKDSALDLAIGWQYRGVHIHSDYLLKVPNVFRRTLFSPDFYYGVGGRLITKDTSAEDKTSLAVRCPVGLENLISNERLNLFVELSGAFQLTPKSDFDLDVGIGIRFKFK